MPDDDDDDGDERDDERVNEKPCGASRRDPCWQRMAKL